MKDKKPKIVLLMETKLNASRMERKRTQLGFDCLFAVDSVGRSRGLALLWMEETGGNQKFQSSTYKRNGEPFPNRAAVDDD